MTHRIRHAMTQEPLKSKSMGAVGADETDCIDSRLRHLRSEYLLILDAQGVGSDLGPVLGSTFANANGERLLTLRCEREPSDLSHHAMPGFAQIELCERLHAHCAARIRKCEPLLEASPFVVSLSMPQGNNKPLRPYDSISGKFSASRQLNGQLLQKTYQGQNLGALRDNGFFARRKQDQFRHGSRHSCLHVVIHPSTSDAFSLHLLSFIGIGKLIVGQNQLNDRVPVLWWGSRRAKPAGAIFQPAVSQLLVCDIEVVVIAKFCSAAGTYVPFFDWVAHLIGADRTRVLSHKKISSLVASTAKPTCIAPSASSADVVSSDRAVRLEDAVFLRGLVESKAVTIRPTDAFDHARLDWATKKSIGSAEVVPLSGDAQIGTVPRETVRQSRGRGKPGRKWRHAQVDSTGYLLYSQSVVVDPAIACNRLNRQALTEALIGATGLEPDNPGRGVRSQTWCVFQFRRPVSRRGEHRGGLRRGSRYMYSRGSI